MTVEDTRFVAEEGRRVQPREVSSDFETTVSQEIDAWLVNNFKTYGSNKECIKAFWAEKGIMVS